MLPMTEKETLVIKFGGTSIGKFPMKICAEIIPYFDTYSNNDLNLKKNYNVVVVCSARSTEVKTKGTTSLLMKVTDPEYLEQKEDVVTEIITEIMDAHIDAGKEFIKSNQVRDAYNQSITEVCQTLKRLVSASRVLGEVPPRTKDSIIGSGEYLSCLFVSAVLEDNSVPSAVVNLDKSIKAHFDPLNLDHKFYSYLANQFADAVFECGSKVPVVTGYFGPVPGSMLHSIGRGYTDLTAALVAVGIQASELQIYKEVDGIFSADPRKVPGARLLDIITPEEASELTYYGSEVVHPFTMEQVMNAMIPIRIKNVQNPSGSGTIISPELASNPVSRSSSTCGRRSPSQTLQHTPEILLKNGYNLDLSRRRPTAVTIKDDIVVVNIHSNKKAVSHDFFDRIFSTLNKFGVVVDLIATSQVHVSMAVQESTTKNVLKDVVFALRKVGEVDIFRGLVILSLVGKQMRNMVGISSGLFTTLAQAGINIEMISQGSSEINISCVISAKHADIALRSVHKALLSDDIVVPKPKQLPEDIEELKTLLDEKIGLNKIPSLQIN
ncbi:hypothetical protein BB560_005041 [Smittium megazygosporum]|uniref:Aspartokinase n=1 Tax=Smittium megazygosporum TaxID=133381 RepID=A0A2T9Z7K8_9FUNG|nr:hypothetical protein BB560_005041 [Smittium megazygosporum]